MQRFLWEVFLFSMLLAFSVRAFSETELRFTADSKPASVHTKRIIEGLRTSLPFSDERDFEEQQRGFLAAPAYREIMADAGHVAWSIETGGIVAQASRDAEEIVVATLDIDRIAESRANWGLFRDRRPDLYSPVVSLA